MKADGGYKEAKIFSLVLIPLLGQYVLTLEEVGGQRLVPIWIGVNEGNAIALEMQGEKFPRPLTHDLIVNMVAALNAKIEKIVVSDLKEKLSYKMKRTPYGQNRKGRFSS